MKKLLLITILFCIIILSSCGEKETPIIILNESVDTIEIGEQWIDEGATIEIDGEVINLTTDDTVDTTTLGVYQVQYTHTVDGETYQGVRFVTVSDQISPIITLNNGIDTVLLHDSWVDSGATVTDNSGEILEISVTEDVDTNVAGTYMVYYSATDSSGNETEVLRVVTVLE